MKKNKGLYILLIILILLVIVSIAILAIINSKGNAVEVDSNANLTAEDIVKKIKEKNQKIGTYVTYNSNTDINELLGRPNQYTSKTTFEDTRIKQTNRELDRDYYTEEEINEPIGGTVEVFNNEKDMQKRRDYLKGVTSLMSFSVEYSYSQSNYLLRLNKSLKPEEAEEYARIFYEITK